MLLSILGVAFTPFAILIVSLISLIGYGVRALSERRKDKKKVKKRLNSLPVYRGRSTGRYNGHAFVDLGLPSRTLWATCNIGATMPNEPGLYFAWGSTIAAKNKNYGGFTIPRLAPQHDAATVHWGYPWRIPSKKDADELINSCNFIKAKYNGKEGLMVIGPNQNTLFLPLTGHIYGWEKKPSFTEHDGNYWLCEESNDSESRSRAYHLHFEIKEDISDNTGFFKSYRIPIRPVFSAYPNSI